MHTASRLFHLIALSLCLLPLAPATATESFDEGIEYQLIVPPQPTSTPDKVEVVEMFWYGCPHCFHLEPEMKDWLKHKPENVEFVRIPAILNPEWAIHARTYYAAEVLGVLDKIHDPLFNALHVERQRLFDLDSIAAFFAKHGVPEEDFRKAYHSFAVEVKLRRAQRLTRAYGINGVPAMIINGKYRTDATLGNGTQGMFRVVDFLVAQEGS
jgi:thiol:disulfide interchange protein DsbA